MNQYQRERKEALESGKNMEEFEKNWRKRTYAAYRKMVKTSEDEHKFRCGLFVI